VVAAAWSAEPTHSKALKLVILAPLGALLVAACGADTTARRLTRAAGLAAFLVLGGLLAVEAFWDLPLNRLANPEASLGDLMRNGNRATTIMLAMTWGVAGALFVRPRGRLAGAAMLAIGGALAPQFDQLANLVAFALGLLVFAIGWAAPRVAIWLSAGSLGAWLLAAPFATPMVLGLIPDLSRMPFGWEARSAIWQYVCARIMEAPLIGHGHDASNVVTDRMVVRGEDMSAIPLHPHSASLQIWFELGLVGALLGVIALIFGARALVRVYGDNRRRGGGLGVPHLARVSCQRELQRMA
jgi:O-antigen ligase